MRTAKKNHTPLIAQGVRGPAAILPIEGLAHAEDAVGWPLRSRGHRLCLQRLRPRRRQSSRQTAGIEQGYYV